MYIPDSLNPASFYGQLSGLALLYVLFLMVVVIYAFDRLGGYFTELAGART